MKHFSAALLFMIAFAACRSHSKKTIVENVSIVDSQLDTFNGPPPLKVKDIPLEVIMERALHYLDSASDLLVAKDQGGMHTKVAGEILVHTRLGDTLRSSLLELDRQCYASLPDSSQRHKLDTVLQLSTQILSREHWEGDIFKNVASMQALTVLSLLRSNAVKAVAIATGQP